MITKEWCQLKEELHQRNPLFGAGGWRWANAVCGIASEYGCRTVLDYGCGKGTLARQIKGHLDVRNYDPAVPEFSGDPEPADMLVSIDMLEHVEPEFLGSTLEYMVELTKKVAFIVVGTRPSDKNMSDGHNAHLIIEQMTWWLGQIRLYFSIIKAQDASEPGYFQKWRRPITRPRGAIPLMAKKRRMIMRPGMEFRCLCTPLC